MARTGTIAIDARLLLYRRGGISRYVRCLSDAIAQLLPTASTDHRRLFRLVVNRPLPDPPIPVLRVRTPPHYRWERWTLGWELTRASIRLFHATDFVLPRLPRFIRRIVTVHDLAFLDAPHELTPEAQRYYRQTLWSLRQADRIIAVSHVTADRIAIHAPEVVDRVRVIHHGVEPRWFAAHPDPARRLAPLLGAQWLHERSTHHILLAVGTVEPRKRYDLLLDAFLATVPVLPARPLLVIVGQEGWNAGNTISRIRELERRGSVRWFSDADDDLLHALYSVAAALVITSRDEGFCLPALEALAAGLPVVAFPVGALPEVLGEAALFVAEQTPRALSRGLETAVLDVSRRRDVIERGRRRARTYDWRTTAERTLAVYQEALADDAERVVGGRPR
ncbi:MAG: glycosyltransferase family 1 protein [Thermomicrobium sp.]|nr:glycosyltransferase family 1 protein [Thermomicrobium sp.]